jgi:transcriptional regulator GlxA family with amidase domain
MESGRDHLRLFLVHRAPLTPVATTVGYESDAAISRAFKKAFGTAPATWRRARSETA